MNELGSKKLIVYLAGGLRSGWQDEVIEACPDVEFLNPRDAYLEAKESGEPEDPKDYVRRDVEWLRKCDVVFLFQESDLPETANCSWELGYAKALGKLCIYVNQRVKPERYASLLALTSNCYTNDLQEGIAWLMTLSRNLQSCCEKFGLDIAYLKPPYEWLD